MANTNRKKATSAQNWKITQRYLRIEHNKIVTAWFRDAGTGTTRASLRNSILIYQKDSAIQVTAKMQFFANYINKKTDDILTLPLQYQTRPLPGVPQLAIIYRPTAKSSKSGNYTLHIPHYNGSRTLNITPHRKGNHWAKFTCQDKSSILVYCSSKAEAVRVATELNRYVDKKYKSEQIKPSTGYMEHKPNKIIKVAPLRADFYQTGKANQTAPNWKYYF